MLYLLHSVCFTTNIYLYFMFSLLSVSMTNKRYIFWKKFWGGGILEEGLRGRYFATVLIKILFKPCFASFSFIALVEHALHAACVILSLHQALYTILTKWSLSVSCRTIFRTDLFVLLPATWSVNTERHTKTGTGARAFCVVAPKVCHDLPESIRSRDSITSF